ncbi:MAG TPA: hypothetical protein VFH58_08845 [Acidimicrobiales bacterium]|nr:hypothetical protein [Acidimicrobiales bacterium]
MSRLRRVLGNAGWLGVLGGVFCLVGLAMLASILMSPNGWAWWMDVHSVQGREVGGLVYYRVDGVSYTLDDAGAAPGGGPHQRTVYYLSAQPSDGALNNVGTQVLDWGSTAGPGAVGLLLLATGLVRHARARRARTSQDGQDTFGQGIPPETVRAIVDRNKAGRP